MTVCEERRPGYQDGPPVGRRRLPCVLPVDHEGVHRTAFRDTFAETDVPDAPNADAAREAGKVRMDTKESPHAEVVHMSRTETLVRQISRTLANPGPESHAVATLNTVDMRFSHLDRLLRDGAPVPAAWKITPDAHDYVTAMYDMASEALRTEGDALECAEALRDAALHWERLTAALREGSPLPEPWSR